MFRGNYFRDSHGYISRHWLEAFTVSVFLVGKRKMLCVCVMYTLILRFCCINKLLD